MLDDLLKTFTRKVAPPWKLHFGGVKLGRTLDDIFTGPHFGFTIMIINTIGYNDTGDTIIFSHKTKDGTQMTCAGFVLSAINNLSLNTTPNGSLALIFSYYNAFVGASKDLTQCPAWLCGLTKFY